VVSLLAIKIGVAGTAKNTGKTTTTAAIIEELRFRGIEFFLTSIGYDGENIDNITGLPKPKIRVHPGDVIATAEKCLQVSTAKLKILDETNISTPLGKVMITKAMTPGLVVTAGPNKSTEVRQLAGILYAMGPGVTIFDGALSRIAPMAETDGIIVATGAAKTPNIPRLSRETERIWQTTNLPTVPRAVDLSELGLTSVTLLDTNLTSIRCLSRPSLLTEQDVDHIFSGDIPDDSFLYIPGILNEKALTELATRLQHQPTRLNLVFADSIKVLVAGASSTYYNQLERLTGLGGFTGVIRSIPLLAITVNPFYTEYRFESKTYKPAFVDFRHLQLSVQRHIRVPVYNVTRQGAKGLVDIIMENARPWSIPRTVYF
jgi:hypothetical protein